MRSSPFTAVYDACVLYPTVLREILQGAAAAGLYQPVWSERMLREWVLATAKLGPEAPGIAAAATAGDTGPGSVTASTAVDCTGITPPA